MVLNMADFVNSCKSLQTLWNACKTVLKWFVTACTTVCVDLGLIRCGRFREFGAMCRSWQNRPCSKPWPIAQAFCSKSANFRTLRINSKSTQTVAQAVTNHFRTVLQAFQRIWSDLQELTKSTMFKTMGYSPGLLLKIGQFSTLPNSP